MVLTRCPPDVHSPACVQAFMWGHKMLGLPDEFDGLSSAQQVRHAARIVRHHFHKNGGELCAVWGKIAGYRLQRTYDHAVLLNVDGTVREAFNRDSEPPAPEIRIKGKRIPVGIFVGG